MNIIDRLRDLDAKATKAPWRADNQAQGEILGSHPTGIQQLVAQMFIPNCEEAGTVYLANEALVVSLRNALPALLDVVTALRCEEEYSHSRSSNEWMGPLADAGWDGKSNPRPFINKLRRAALAALERGA